MLVAIARAVREKLSSSPNFACPATRISVIRNGGRYRFSTLNKLPSVNARCFVSPGKGDTRSAARITLAPSLYGSDRLPELSTSAVRLRASGSPLDQHPWPGRARNVLAADFVNRIRSRLKPAATVPGHSKKRVLACRLHSDCCEFLPGRIQSNVASGLQCFCREAAVPAG